MSRILYWPKVREQIIGRLEDLLDEDFRKTWFDSNYKHAFWDDLYTKVFEGLYEDTDEAVGVSLYNKEEEREFEKYLDFFSDTFEADMPDSYYVNHHEWPRLLEWAKEILDMMEVNNKKYNYENDIKEWEDEQNAERQQEISDALDKMDSFSEEEKEEMKASMTESRYDSDFLKFIDITNHVLDKILAKNAKRQQEILDDLDKINSFSQEEKDEMKAKMRDSNIFQFIDISNEILEKIKSAKSNVKN